MRLVDDHVHEDAARQFLMQARGREVHVARHVLPFLDHRLADQVFRAAPLMRGHDVLVAVVFLDRFFQMIEVAAAGVGFIAQHDARPLAIAHRAGAAVGEQIDVDIFRSQQERVVTGFLRGALASGAIDHGQRLDHLDLPGLGPGSAAKLLAHGFGGGGHWLFLLKGVGVGKE